MDPGSPHTRPQMTGAARYAMLTLAGVFILLGLIGLFLPVVPTVPFLLVAAWAAARSSPELNDWMHNHPRFGKPLCDWRDGGFVPRRAKWLATVMMSGSAIFMLLLVPQKWAVGIVIFIMASVLVWLWRRPECVVPPEA